MTQFEAATAAAFVALAAARVEVGGDRGRAGRAARRDQHDPLAGHRADLDRPRPHRVAGGDRARDRRREAGGAARPDDPGPRPGLRPRSRRWPSGPRPSAARALVRAPEDPGPEVRLRAPGGFQRRNFALACAAAEAFLGELDPERVAAVAGDARRSPAGSSGSPSDPPTFLDAAHNPDGAAALAEALPAVAGGRPVVACLAVLADKDAEAMVAALAPALDRAVCTELPADGAESATARPGARPSRPAAELARALRGGRAARPRPSPTSRAALRRGRAARRRAAGGRPARHRLPLRAGARRGRRSRIRLCEDSAHGSTKRRLRTALDDGSGRRRGRVVILVFFGVGYLFGQALPLRHVPRRQGSRPARRSRLPAPLPAGPQPWH